MQRASKPPLPPLPPLPPCRVPVPEPLLVPVCLTGVLAVWHRSLAPTDAESDPAARAKRIRNLNKKLKQIEKLKADRASGKELNEDQLGKLEGEASIVEEIRQLEAMD